LIYLGPEVHHCRASKRGAVDWIVGKMMGGRKRRAKIIQPAFVSVGVNDADIASRAELSGI
jgi:hypothetical protein